MHLADVLVLAPLVAVLPKPITSNGAFGKPLAWIESIIVLKSIGASKLNVGKQAAAAA